MNQNNSDIEVTVIIPTRNEEAAIGECITKIKNVFKTHNLKGEIIVSDNSDDNTPKIARKLGARVVNPDKLGYGYAYRYALRYARGKYIIFGDGDNTYDFNEIPKLLEPLRSGDADLVIGTRLKGKIMPGAMPLLHKYIGNPLLTYLINLFFKVGVSDAHCGFRAIKKDAIQKLHLRTSGMEFASELLIEAVRHQLKIKEVPISYYPRKGSSKLHSFKDGWRHLKFMLIQVPEWLYLIPSLTSFLLGFTLLILGYIRIRTPFYVPGTYSMIAGSLLIILAVQLGTFGIYSKLYQAKKGYKETYVVKMIKKYLTLEKGIAIGLTFSLFGVIHILYLAQLLITHGYKNLPFRGEYMIGFTLLVIGIQIVSSSFMISMLQEEDEVRSYSGNKARNN